MIRSKRPEADLRYSYRRVFWACVGASVALHAALFALFPSFEVRAYTRPRKPVVIRLEEIPATRQERRPPPPPRPVVPIATENPDVPDDITIASTELDLDDLPPPPPPEEEGPAEAEIELEEETDEVVAPWMTQRNAAVIKRVMPEYPELARRAGIEGKVFVEVVVGKDGKVAEIRKMTGPELLRQAAEKAALQWEFSPALQNDQPVKVWATIPFTFQIR